MSDTFARSCLHWSEDKRRGMEEFYALATADYRHLADAFDWKTLFEGWQSEAGERSLKLLDVACGSGKFPTALLDHAGLADADIEPVSYALLDPSAFSIAEAKQALRAPFVPRDEFHTTLQRLDCPAKAFDLVWATHALYAVPPEELELALSRFVHAIGRIGFIAHACQDAHYIRFYKLFLDDFRGGSGQLYTTAEDIVAALGRLGATVRSQDIQYANRAPRSARAQVEGFLQRCVFDDTVTLEDLGKAPHTGPYLQDCGAGDEWRFAQRVKLIFIEPS